MQEAYPLGTMTDFLGRLVVMAMMIVFPLAVGSQRYFNITAFKGNTFRTIFCIAALLMFGALVLNLSTRQRKPGRNKGLLSGDPEYDSGAFAISGSIISALTLIMYTGGQTYTTFNIVLAAILSLCVIAAFAVSALKRREPKSPAAFIDWALTGYGLWTWLSALTANDIALAFVGRDLRNNGVLIQLGYIALWFLVSRFVKANSTSLTVTVGGGTLFALGCLLHDFGADIFNMGGIVGKSYAGPFYDTVTKFMGSMGNVNLGSYVIAVMCILAAASYVCAIPMKLTGTALLAAISVVAVVNFDTLGFFGTVVIILLGAGLTYGVRKFAETKQYNRAIDLGIFNILCFAVMLFAELGMQTDAGYVALAAGLGAIIIVFCSDPERVSRIFTLLSVTAAVFVLRSVITDIILGKDSFGAMHWILLAGCAVMAACAVYVRPLIARIGVTPSARTLRIIALVLCVIVAGSVIVTALSMSAPSGSSTGVLAAADEHIVLYDRWSKSYDPVSQLGQILRGHYDDSLGNNRLFTWKRVLTLSGENPILGYGPDNFKPVFAARFGEEADVVFSSTGGLDKAHNEYLDILFSSGIPALLLMLAFLGLLLYNGIRRADNTPICAVFAVAVIAYCTHAFFGYQLPLHSPIMWTLLGLAAAAPEVENTTLGK